MGSIPSQIILKTVEMVPIASLLAAQYSGLELRGEITQ